MPPKKRSPKISSARQSPGASTRREKQNVSESESEQTLSPSSDPSEVGSPVEQDQALQDPYDPATPFDPEDTTNAPEEAVSGRSEPAQPVDHGRGPKPVDVATANVKWKRPATEGEPDGLILEPDEEERYEGTETGNMVTITRDVYRKVFPHGALRPTYIRLYKAGTQVPITSTQQMVVQSGH